jgi:tellurite methyltransferase
MARPALGPERYESLTGKSLQKDIKGQWDMLYGRSGFVYGKKPVKFLAENFHLIPKMGKVLDVGMGEGRNAVFLATKDYDVTGIDISSVALKKAEELAKEYDVSISTVLGDAKKYQFKPNSFDAVLCFYYVDRELLPVLINLIKPGGYLYYEAYTIDQKLKAGLKDDEDSYYLKSGELKNLLSDLKIIKYEEGIFGNEYRASAIARKP